MTWIWDAGGNDGFNDVRNLTKVEGDRHGIIFLPWKALLVAAGWTVEGSGDGASLYEFRGTTAGSGTGSGGAYDVWTIDNNAHDGAAGNVSNALAWCVLKAPTGTMEILLIGTNQTGSGYDAYGLIMFSHADGYVAAGISATVSPAAVTDEQALTTAGRGAPAGANIIGFTGSHYIHLGANTEPVNGIYGFWWADVTTAGTRFNMFQLTPIVATRSWDVAPYFWLDGNSGNGGRTWEKKGLTGEAWFNNSAWSAQLLFGGSFWLGLGSYDPETGDLPMGEPMIKGKNAVGLQEHFRGTLPQVRMRAYLSDSQPVTADYPSYTEQDPDGIVWLHWLHYAFPWDNTASPPTPLGGSGGVTNVEWFRMTDIAPVTVATSFVMVAFDPLRSGLSATTDTTLTMTLSETPGTLDSTLVTIQIDGVTIYSTGTWSGEYTGSSVTPLGGGDFQFDIVKDTPWSVSARVEVKVFLPGESP